MIALRAIVWRELLRFVHQKERFLAALVRPLIWLFIFAVGFRAALGLSINPPYETYIKYEVYIVPGLCAMTILFNSLQSSLSMVYDRELGSMRMLLSAPISRAGMLAAKLIAGAVVSILQVLIFLTIARVFGVNLPLGGYLFVIPFLALCAFGLGAMGLFLSALIPKLQNFAGIMNFVIFPMFFASSALYPLWHIQENAPLLADIVRLNPFTYNVELIRFALYGQIEWFSLAVTVACLIVFFGLALWGYENRKKV